MTEVTAAAQTQQTQSETKLATANLADNFDTFLVLLTEQLKNQDPLDPLESEQFVQQLVQFSSVEQQIASNESLEALLALQADGHGVREVARRLNELLPPQVFCDAWTFDSFWLHRLFRAANLQPEFQLESISMLLSPQQVREWSGVRQQVIAELGLPIHRAANDALILHTTWKRITCQDEAAE